MAFLTKEQYEARQRYADRKMAKNAEIKTLTEEQHDALSEICSIRHRVHSSNAASALFNTESSDYDRFWDYICGDEIKEFIEDNNLPKWEWRGCDPCDYGCNTDLDWDCLDLPNEDDFENREEYEKKVDEISDNAREKYLDELYDLVERWNDSIEAYLREIDEQCGTEYCPTGSNRLY